MPQKIKTISTTALFILLFAIAGLAQTITPASAPSSAEIMRERIARAKAFIVVKNYNAAIYELDNIRRESADPTLASVINVLLMNSFFEQGDYKRAEDFLITLSKDQKAGKPNAAANYFAVSAQIIKSTRNQIERYHAMGLNVSDRTLPEAAAADVEKMRMMLEMVIEQSKVFGQEKKYADTAISLLEGATAARGTLAKDDYDANRWRIEIADAREQLTNSRSTVINAVNMPPVPENDDAAGSDMPSVLLPVGKDTTPATVAQKKQADPPVNNKPADETVAKLDNPVEKPQPEEAKKTPEPKNDSSPQKRDRLIVRSAPKTEPTREDKKAEPETVAEQTTGPKDNTPLAVGSLVSYATKKANPVYPSVARNMRMTGIVKVEVLLDEDGKVAEVQNTDGPSLLQDAAEDAIKKWKFTPFKRDGEPVKAVGYISFNFSL